MAELGEGAIPSLATALPLFSDFSRVTLLVDSGGDNAISPDIILYGSHKTHETDLQIITQGSASLQSSRSAINSKAWGPLAARLAFVSAPTTINQCNWKFTETH